MEVEMILSIWDTLSLEYQRSIQVKEVSRRIQVGMCSKNLDVLVWRTGESEDWRPSLQIINIREIVGLHEQERAHPRDA